jgi:hypothetical protein
MYPPIFEPGCGPSGSGGLTSVMLADNPILSAARAGESPLAETAAPSSASKNSTRARRTVIASLLDFPCLAATSPSVARLSSSQTGSPADKLFPGCAHPQHE